MKLRQYFVKLKIPKSFNMGKWERCIEYFARLFVLASVIVLAMWTIFTSPLGVTWFAKGFLIIFISAAAIVFYFEARHLFRKQPSNQQESTQIPTDIERAGRNKWISIGLLVLVAIVIGLFFLAQQLPATTRGYQTFFTAFAAIAALVTGVALVLVAYQQYKLRHTEHSLLFEPQILLRSGGTPIAGAMTYNNKKYPYCIEWTVFIHNTSQQPIVIVFMSLGIRQLGWGKVPDKDGYLSIPSYHVLEPEGLESQFQVTQTTPQKIRWIIEGYNAAGELGDSFGDSNNRNFQLIFYVQAINPQDPSTPIIYGINSNSFRIPKDAPWGDKIPTLT